MYWCQHLPFFTEIGSIDTHPESTLASVSHCHTTLLSDALPPSYPCPVLLRALAPTLGIFLRGFGFIILCEHILSSTRCCRYCLHQRRRMTEEELRQLRTGLSQAGTLAGQQPCLLGLPSLATSPVTSFY